MKKRYICLPIIILASILSLYLEETYALKEESPVLKKIDITDEGEKVRILIEGSSSLTYTIFKLSDPTRVVVDLTGAEAGNLKGKIDVRKGPVQDILTTEKDKPSKLVRIEIGLTSAVDVTPFHQDNKLFIDIPKQVVDKRKEETDKLSESSIEETTTKTVAKTADKDPSITKSDVKKGNLYVSNKEEKLKKPATAVTGVKIDKEKGLRVIISGDGEMKYQAFILKPNRLVVDIADAVNKAKPVTYDVGDPLLSNIRIGQHTDPKKKVRVVLDLTQTLPYEVVRDKNQLIISIKSDSNTSGSEVTTKKKDIEVTPDVKEKESRNEAKADAEEKTLPAKPEISTKKNTVAKKEVNKSALSAKASKKNKIIPFKKDDVLVKEIPSMEIFPLAQKMEESATSQGAAEKPAEAKVPETAVSGKYTGRRISLDFQDADIISILRLISEVSGMNIIASPEVKGKITVKMLNVPWDQALDIILKTYHLGKVVEDNIIRVAPVPVLAKERSEIAKAKEELAKSEDLVSKIIPLGYANPKPMKAAIDKAKVLSPRGNVSTDDRTNTLIIRDIQKNLSEVEALISVLDKPTPQVSIEAKIVEASTNFSRELGIQWGFKNIQDSAHGNPLPYTFPRSMTFGGSTLAGTSPGTSPSYMSGNPWAVNLPAAVAAGSGGALGIALGSITNSFTLDLQISAMEGTGQGKILSNPKIVTLDNEKAMIKQGRKIPYATVSAEGTKTEFVDAVLSLTVTPSITPGGAISMKIEVTKDEPGATTSAGPIIEKKEASTNVLVRDGETIVIGGILTTKKLDDTAGVPLLSKIPILGWLFKKETVKEDTTELLIFITPRIVKPS
ncbi:MAG: type IV pilus secretin PilQ [Nitrospirota bacterium]